MLYRAGVVDSAAAMSQLTQFHPSQRNSSPALHILSRRSTIATQHDEELNDPITRGKRNWVDTDVVRRMIQMRDEMGWDDARIESELGLKQGLVGRLGSRAALP